MERKREIEKKILKLICDRVFREEERKSVRKTYFEKERQ